MKAAQALRDKLVAEGVRPCVAEDVVKAFVPLVQAEALTTMANTGHVLVSTDQLAEALHHLEHADHLFSTGCRLGHRVDAQILLGRILGRAVAHRNGLIVQQTNGSVRGPE